MRTGPKDIERVRAVVIEGIDSLDQALATFERLASGCERAKEMNAGAALLADYRFHNLVSRAGSPSSLEAILKTFPERFPAQACAASQHGMGYLSLALSPDDRWLVATTREPALHLYDVGSGKLIGRVRQGLPRTVPGLPLRITFSADGTLLAVAGSQGPVVVLALPSGRRVAVGGREELMNPIVALTSDPTTGASWLVVDGLGGAPEAVPITSNGRTVRLDARYHSEALAAAPERPLAYARGILWDPRRGTILRRLRSSEQRALPGAFSRDGRLLAIAGLEGGSYVRLVDPDTGRERRRIRLGNLRGKGIRAQAARHPITGLAFLEDGRRLLVWQDEFVSLVDPKRKPAVHTVRRDPSFFAMAVASDGESVYVLDLSRGLVVKRRLSEIFGCCTSR